MNEIHAVVFVLEHDVSMKTTLPMTPFKGQIIEVACGFWLEVESVAIVFGGPIKVYCDECHDNDEGMGDILRNLGFKD